MGDDYDKKEKYAEASHTIIDGVKRLRCIRIAKIKS